MLEVTHTGLVPGRVLSRRWRLDAQLGGGGVATVWSATHRNGLRVAVKVLRPELSANRETRARFLREGYVANHIGHPDVLTVLDDDTTEDGLVFLVTELLEGSTLAQAWLSRERQFATREVIAVAIRILAVLEVAHAKGVVHRDLKPQNVFLPSSGGIKVLDFGVARLRDGDDNLDRTRAGTILGTPPFMPPEQALGHWEEVDGRSDLFAVGATMWTLLTGRLIHHAPTLQELLIEIATTPVKPIAELLPALDPRVAGVIDRALHFRRDERWSSAADMRAALELTRDGDRGEMQPRSYAAPHTTDAQILDRTPTSVFDTNTTALVQAAARAAERTHALRPLDSAPPTAQPANREAERTPLRAISAVVLLAAASVLGVAVWGALATAQPEHAATEPMPIEEDPPLVEPDSESAAARATPTAQASSTASASASASTSPDVRRSPQGSPTHPGPAEPPDPFSFQ
jgi:eukaryotic-like serine/threonine-protein kinase